MSPKEKYARIAGLVRKYNIIDYNVHLCVNLHHCIITRVHDLD